MVTVLVSGRYARLRPDIVKEGNDGNIKILLTARVVDIGYSVMINESLGTSCSTIQNHEDHDIVVLSDMVTLTRHVLRTVFNSLLTRSCGLSKASMYESKFTELMCERRMHCRCLFILYENIK